MGNTESTGSGLGFHVLKVEEHSPAALAGIEPHFDYIIGVDGQALDTSPNALINAVKSSSEIELTIYSTRRQDIRNVSVKLSNEWSSSGSLLGCSIRFCGYTGGADHVWHVLHVHDNSPAQSAGLIPQSDYILGSPYYKLPDKEALYRLIEQNINHEIVLIVYNSDLDSVREIVVNPNYDWNGEGCLGCDIGYGFLHRIPTKNPMMNISFDQNSAIAAADLFEDQPEFPIIKLSPAPQKSPVKSVPSFKAPHTPGVSSNLTNEIVISPKSNVELTSDTQHIFGQGYQDDYGQAYADNQTRLNNIVAEQELPESLVAETANGVSEQAAISQPFTEVSFILPSKSPKYSSQPPIQSFSPPKAITQPGIQPSSPPKATIYPEPVSDLSSIFGSAPNDFLSNLPTKASPRIEPIKTSPTDYFDQIRQEQVTTVSSTTTQSQKPKVEVLESSSLFSSFAPNFL